MAGERLRASTEFLLSDTCPRGSRYFCHLVSFLSLRVRPEVRKRLFLVSLAKAATRLSEGQEGARGSPLPKQTLALTV